MDDHSGRITIIASSTMVHHRVRCMICGRPVDHRVVFMTNDARVLHAGCVPDHVKVPTPVLLQAIRRLERMVDRARSDDRHAPDPATAVERDPDESGPRPGSRPQEEDPRPGSRLQEPGPRRGSRLQEPGPGRRSGDQGSGPAPAPSPKDPASALGPDPKEPGPRPR